MSNIPRLVIALVGLAAAGGFIADVLTSGTASRHLRDPRWPPHAKFHNGQGVLMGIGLALLTPWLLFGLRPQSVGTLAAGAVAASLYWLSMLIAILLIPAVKSLDRYDLLTFIGFPRRSRWDSRLDAEEHQHGS